MRIPSLLSTLVLLILAAPSAASRTWSVADLEGGFSLGEQAIGPATNGVTLEPTVGTIVFDGAGHVVGGTRFVVRFASPAVPGGAMETEDFVQSATGTAVVDPDGTGRLSVTWAPPLPRTAFPGSACQWNDREPVETYRIALDDTGFQYLHEIRPFMLAECTGVLAPDNGTYPRTPHVMSGVAVRQERACCEAAPAVSVRTRPER